MFLGELEQTVKSLKGIGPVAGKTLANMGIFQIRDLLTHYPRDYEYRNRKNPFFPGSGETEFPRKVNTIAEVTGQEYFGFGKKRTLKIYCRDESGTAVLLCFGRNFLASLLPPGKKIFLAGSFSCKFNELGSGSFEYEEFSENPRLFNRILPVYPLSGRLTQGFFRTLIQRTLREYGENLESELPLELLEHRNLLSKAAALENIHFPENEEKKEQAQKTLVYEELLFFQIQLYRRGLSRREPRSRPRIVGNTLEKKCIASLPFSLTPDQHGVLKEIKEDLASNKRMNRLLQGDVGSGKTLAAFLAALSVIEAGFQAAFMAPTELLARQHGRNAARLLCPLGISPTLLLGSMGGEKRSALMDAIKTGKTEFIIGTHALFSLKTEYRNLALIIIDEQHRFGVMQRKTLLKKGETPDLLMMTATPIPRSLALTSFGDLDISTIRTMPPGRKSVITHLAVQGKEKKVYNWVRKEIKKGRQAYFVYPLISQSGEPALSALKDVESMYSALREKEFPEAAMGLIHSQIPSEERENTMERFTRGEIDILIATSVVEVGVDVPNATCMVVEHAERFGLAALHQLRGRVGRGEHQSYAFLVYSPDLTEAGKKRLKVMMETNDGFRVAEADLSIRGPGEVAGTKQSGFIPFSIADISRDTPILKQAREDAIRICDADPGFISSKYRVVGNVLSRVRPFKDFFLEEE